MQGADKGTANRLDGKDLRVNGKSPYFRIVVRRKTDREAATRRPGDAALADGQTLMF